MRKIILSTLFASSLALPALPAAAQYIQGILVEPRHPTASDRLQLTAIGLPGQCRLSVGSPFYDPTAAAVVLPAQPAPECPRPDFQHAFYYPFEFGPLPAGLHYAEVRIQGLPGFTRRELIEVRPTEDLLDLGDGDRFQVRLRWSNPRDGSSGMGHAKRLGEDSGAFWFFTPENLEVTVKILDGRAVNGHWWVFIASMTDLAFEVEISRAGGPARTYVQTAGQNRNFIDVDASFVEGQQPVSDPVRSTPEIVVEPQHPTPSDPVHVEVSVLNTEPDLSFLGVEGRIIFFNYDTYEYPSGGPPPPDQRVTAEATVGPLAPGVYTVDVRQDSRHAFGHTFQVSEPSTQLRFLDTPDSYFNVYVNIDTPRGGVGRGVQLTNQSGYFWFFDPGNIELTVKILDGRGVNGKYWVFIASMTDVPFTVEVERCVSHFDPFGCGSQYYRGLQGVNQNFIDTEYP